MKFFTAVRSMVPPKAVMSGGLMAAVAYASTSALHQFAHVDVPADVMASVFGALAGVVYHVIPSSVQAQLDAADEIVRTVGPVVSDAVSAK